MINTKLGYQFLGKPPESYRAKCGGSKGIKIVGNETDLTQLRDWVSKVEILQGRLITAERTIEQARERNILSEIPKLAETTAALYAGVQERIGVPGVWFEVPYIMPEVSPWTAAWYPAAAEAFKARGLRSVVFGFATGTPQVTPWANQGGHGPDEWFNLHDALARLDKVGTDWTRIGVEEYIAGGWLDPADWSNVGRIKEVWERHIRPNGWNILFRGIETGYDNPGMKDAGIIPQNLLEGNHPQRQPGHGLAAMDARYATLPYIDCLFLYQVSDPVVYVNEAKFAFTPGDKHAPVGYLETMQEYFAANPPAPFTVPDLPPIIEVPPPVEPEPEPEPVNLLVNGSFEDGHTFDQTDTFGDRKVPAGWGIGWNTKQAAPHVELDQHPPRVTDGVTALRIWADDRFQAWAWQRVTVTPGAVYELRDRAIGHRLDTKRGKVQVDIAVDTFGGTDYTLANYKSGNTSEEEWRTPTIRFTATQPTATVFVEVRTGNDGRGDGWHDGVELVKVVEAPPGEQPQQPGLYKVVGGVNIRRQPNKSTAPVGSYTDGAPVTIEKFVQGAVENGNSWWGLVAGQGLYVSGKYLVRS